MPINQPKTPPKGWLWSEDAADYLGVSVTTLYRWRRDGYGPKSSIHGRRRYRYKVSDLDAWMEIDSEPADLARVAA
ncbi:helix-turn-helix domain-containing protein [Streptomyces sp. NEAU-sy36]|uniref:helix-turn-helix transcriptional regulator n=1 Tax=unclassified Streptomyces TaxID=2593676 RepID=UPI0015D5745C|nr:MULTISPECIES: helix-turn-helix domain-containing protein [unclassified Streptomyces]QLJ01474.1 helix-turn-helix domain-containing protein [Streptomyces sp. NEAU-sy36]